MENCKIVLCAKSQAFRLSRRLTRQIENVTSWVEEALDTVIGVMADAREPVSDYLRWEYPETLAGRSRGPIFCRSCTLPLRMSFMLRCLYRCRADYLRLQRWQFSGLEGMFNIFVVALRQCLGDGAAPFDAFLGRLRAVWNEGTCPWANAEEMGEEMEALRTELPVLFENLREAFRAHEAASAHAAEASGRLAAISVTLDEIKAGQEEIRTGQDALKTLGEAAVRAQRRHARLCERVVGGGEAREEDVYSREAGLGAYPGARGKEIRRAIAFCHAEYPVAMHPKRGEPSLRQLARACWTAHEAEFANLAKLPLQPGFKNWQCLSTALYALARKYPAAGHFRYR